MALNIKIPCPYCAEAGHRGSRALSVHRIKGIFHCFRCNETGHVSRLVRDHGMDVSAVVDPNLREEDLPKYNGDLPEEFVRLSAENHRALSFRVY